MIHWWYGYHLSLNEFHDLLRGIALIFNANLNKYIQRLFVLRLALLLDEWLFSLSLKVREHSCLQSPCLLVSLYMSISLQHNIGSCYTGTSTSTISVHHKCMCCIVLIWRVTFLYACEEVVLKATKTIFDVV